MYFDTSVLVAYYCPEPMSAQVEALIRRQPHPLISELVEVEFSSAVALKVRQHGLSRTDGFKILAQFQQHLDQHLFTRLHLNSSHYQLAKTWLMQLQWSLRSLDALHLAVVELHQSILVTADLSMAKTANLIGLEVQLLSSQKKHSDS